jgi:hypothetical protein
MYKMSNLAGYNTINDVNLTGLSNVYADEITAEDVIVPRINPNLTSLLGSQINLTELVQNLNWNTTTKGFEIWDNIGTGQMMSVNTDVIEIDISPAQLNMYPLNGIYIGSAVTYTGHSSSYINHQISLNPNCSLNVNSVSISPVELSYLDGLTSNIQTTFNGLPTNYVTTTTTQNVGGYKVFNDAVSVLGAFECVNNAEIGSDLSFSNKLIVYGREEIFYEPNAFVNIANYAFDTPVRSLNTGATVTSPYTAITGWTFTLVSGASPTTVATGRGFWDSNPAGPNSLVFYYPGYSTVNQCIGIRQDTASSFRLSQSVTVSLTGTYIVSFWIWGRYNSYSTTQTIASSFGTGSVTGVQASEQFWKKVSYRAYVTSGTHTLSITFNQTSAVASAICLTYIQIQLANGLIVGDDDSALGNSNIITPTGLTTNSIYNNGQLWNYGDFTLYGSFAPFLAFVKNSAVIGDCKYGTRSVDTGEHNYIFGYGIGTNIKQGGSSGTLNRVIAIGSGPIEQAATITDAIAIGRFANRYSGSDTSICIGNNAGQYFGYANRVNMSNNICLGHESIGAVFSTGNQYNIAIGNSTMRTGGDFSNSRAFNTVVGHNSGYAIASNNHSVLGYNSYINNTNIASSNNVVVGANAANLPTTGQINQCTFLGANTNTAIATSSYRNSTAVGAYAIVETDNTIVLGGLNQSDLVTYPNVVLPNKLTLQSATLYNSATLNLTIGRLQSQNYILETPTVTTINLPSVAPTNVGLTFTILRGYIPVSGDNFTIYTAGGLSIQSARVNPAPSYTVDYTITWITITLVSTTGTINWVANYTRKLATVQDGTTAADIPVCFQSAGDDVALLKIDSPTFTFNPSTETLRVTNLTTTNPIYQKQESAITVSTTTNLTVDITAGSSSLYRFCNMGTATVTYRLPTITASTVGWEFRIRRMYGSNYNSCTINPSAFTTQAIILEGTGVPTVSTTAVTISATQSSAQFVSTIVQLGGFTGTFTNTLGSSTIQIVTITAGNIVMVGGILNLNGNIRTITAYGTGKGQTGTYTVSASINVANTNQSFTATESYGYIRTEVS